MGLSWSDMGGKLAQLDQMTKWARENGEDSMEDWLVTRGNSGTIETRSFGCWAGTTQTLGDDLLGDRDWMETGCTLGECTNLG